MPNEIANKTQAAPPVPTVPSQAALSARDRAIAKLKGTNVIVEDKKDQPKQELAVDLETPPAKEEKTLSAAVEEAQVQDTNVESTESVAEAVEETEPAKADPKDPAISSQYAILARKEKQHRAKVQEQNASMQAKEVALKAREDALAAKDNEYKQGYVSKQDFQKNPWKYLAEAGISYDQLTEQALNQTKSDPYTMSKLEALEAKLAAQDEAHRKERDDFNKKQEEQQTNAYKQALENIRRDAEKLVKGSEDYELIAATESTKDIVELIEQTWKEDQVLLTVEEAAAEVEKYLEEEALKLSRLKKIQTKLQAPGTKTVTFKESEAKEPKQSQMKTLTNAIGATRPLSARDRAIQAMNAKKTG